jgi:Protein of unknown function (DUF2652)
MATEPARLLIADISGYTGYLAGVELDHAQDILADLMGAIVSALRPGFRLAKLEGDAAFTFAVTDRIDGSLLLDTIERCYFGFRRRRRDVHQANTCGCNACLHIPDLDLKFVVHHGEILRQRIAGGEELLGSDVILAHRLLKSDVVASTGTAAYALFSQACVDAMDVDVAAIGMRQATETTPDGTVLHVRMAPAASLKGRLAARVMAPMLAKSFATAQRRLVEQLDAALAQRGQDGATEPELPRPRPDGPLASLPPSA